MQTMFWPREEKLARFGSAGLSQPISPAGHRSSHRLRRRLSQFPSTTELEQRARDPRTSHVTDHREVREN